MARDPARANGGPRRRRAYGQDGNTLILMPIGVLVVLALAAIAVDSALLYRAQAELDAAAAGLANDAAAGVDPASLFDPDRDVVLDRTTLDELAHAHAAVADDLAATCTIDITATGPQPAVDATCTGTAHLLFRSVVGAPDRVTITTTASGDLRRD